jgi:hypothetical protein
MLSYTIFILFCQPVQIAISHNVLGLRRFASPDKGFAQQSPGLAKCAAATAWEQSDLAVAKAEGPSGPEA